MTQITFDSRWAREIEHFDDHYRREADAGIEPLSEWDQLRYTNPGAETIYPREFYYHLLAPLRIKSTLEIACGNGIDASICAHNGAQVHAYDISLEAVTLTRKRAAVNHVDDRVQVACQSNFMDAFQGQRFDAIMGYAALHHLENLDELAQQVYDRLKPGGAAVFAEPVVNSQALASLRKLIPYHIDEMTEDETPLRDADIDRFAKPFDRMVRREFQCVSRVWRMFPSNMWLAEKLHQIDASLLRLPPMRRFATVVVFGLYRDR